MVPLSTCTPCVTRYSVAGRLGIGSQLGVSCWKWLYTPVRKQITTAVPSQRPMTVATLGWCRDDWNDFSVGSVGSFMFPLQPSRGRLYGVHRLLLANGVLLVANEMRGEQLSTGLRLYGGW